jgi:spoIIIJ-associated protein
MQLNDFLAKLLDSLLLDGYDLEIIDDEDKLLINVKVSADDSGILIGRGGEVLLSIQRLLRVLFGDELAEKKLLLNINDYRDAREQKTREQARRAAAKVLQNGRRYVMHGLNSVERFLIHQTISEEEEFSQLTSYSEGEGHERVLVIDFVSTP